MYDGDGTTQGSCDSGFLCYADGNCKGMIGAFIYIILIGNDEFELNPRSIHTLKFYDSRMLD